MRKPTMTLQDIQRALAEQDCHLKAAYRALTDPSRDASLTLHAGAFARLADACEATPAPRNALNPHGGIRC
jgi:hypothetical protein